MTNETDEPDANQRALWEAQGDMGQALATWGRGLLHGFNNHDESGYARSKQDEGLEALSASLERIVEIKLAMAFAKLTQTGKA